MDSTATGIDALLITKCINGNRKSQKELYLALAPKMFPVCIKFFSNREDAEDILQEGFIKLFNNLYKFRGEGSFEGWARRIFVNTAIEYYRRQKPYSVCIEDYGEIVSSRKDNPLANLFQKDLIKQTNELSDGYRTIFLLYAVEGYSHREISRMLGISESTSKSQYSRAKATLRELPIV